MKSIQIAIDGPSGAGKSTVAKALAQRLGIVYVDTGALYRTVGYAVRQANADPKDPEAVAALLPQLHLDLRYEADGTQQVYLNGEAMGNRIRTPEMSPRRCRQSLRCGRSCWILSGRLRSATASLWTAGTSGRSFFQRLMSKSF